MEIYPLIREFNANLTVAEFTWNSVTFNKYKRLVNEQFTKLKQMVSFEAAKDPTYQLDIVLDIAEPTVRKINKRTPERWPFKNIGSDNYFIMNRLNTIISDRYMDHVGMIPIDGLDSYRKNKPIGIWVKKDGYRKVPYYAKVYNIETYGGFINIGDNVITTRSYNIASRLYKYNGILFFFIDPESIRRQNKVYLLAFANDAIRYSIVKTPGDFWEV